jgi:uncharacterized membrane protein
LAQERDMVSVVGGTLGLLLVVAFLWLFRAILRLERRVIDLEAHRSHAMMNGPGRVPDTSAEAGQLPDPAKPPAEGDLLRSGETEAQASPHPPDALPDAPPVTRPKVHAHAAVDGAEDGAEDSQNRPVVFRQDRVSALAGWLLTNWIITVSGLSLALAGLFLVQYGVERGFLPPSLRVIAALIFGAGLIAAGEWIRHRFGDQMGATAFMPAIFSAAGLSVIFSAILAARLMYGLIGPIPTFVGLMATAMVALVLGWFHGSALAGMGLIGAVAAPFLTGGDADAPAWLYAYVALVIACGLGIDTVRHWGWVSVLALALGYGAGVLIQMAGGGDTGLLLLVTALAAMAVTIPDRALMPRHDGAGVIEAVLSGVLAKEKPPEWPAFPTRLAAGAVAVSVVLAVVTMLRAEAMVSLLALGLLATMAVAAAIWAWRAPALSDLAPIPLAGFVAGFVIDGITVGDLSFDFTSALIFLRPPETSAPDTLGAIIAMACVMALAMGWRAAAGADRPRMWAALAALAPLATAMSAELLWSPALVLGPYPWALHVMAAAVLMTSVALMQARRRVADHCPHTAGTAYATLSMLSLIALALFVILTEGALTLAIVAVIVAAAALDRRFRLPELGWFVSAGVAVVTWRLAMYLILGGIHEAPLAEVLAVHGGSLAGAVVADWMLRDLPRRRIRAVLDIGALVFAAFLANAVMARALEGLVPKFGLTFWYSSLQALPWLAMALVQAMRIEAGNPLRGLRRVLCWLAGLFWLGAMIWVTVSVLPGFDPLVEVAGPPLANTLAVAFLLPAALLLTARRQLAEPRLRWILGGLGTLLCVIYAGFEIRSWFHAGRVGESGVTQGELYAYTVALILTSAAMVWQALTRPSAGLRRGAMALIGLTIAKVFLVDISGLEGLTRVGSFLVLGLALAWIAWLNRWISERQEAQRRP